MKKLLGLALAAAMLFMLCSIVPSMAAITVRLNIDEISLKNASDGKVTDLPKEGELGQLKAHVQAGGTKIFFNGWYAPPKPLADAGLQTDDGDITWGLGKNDGTGNIIAKWVGFDENGPWTLRISGSIPVQEGKHTFKVVVKFTDNTTSVIHSAEYLNNDDAAPVVYKNYSGSIVTNPETCLGKPSMWLGHTNTNIRWQVAFNTDVSFSAINFPQAWAYAQSPFQVTIARDGHFDDGIVFVTDIVRPSDGAFRIDLGKTLPAGQYVMKFKLTDETKTPEGRYQRYLVLGHAENMLDSSYCLHNLAGVSPVFEIVSTDNGQGFIPREIVTRINVDGATAGGTDLGKTDGATTEIPAGTTSMSFNGWVSSNFAIESFGYSIDGGDVVYDSSFRVEEEDHDNILQVARNTFGFPENADAYRLRTEGGIPLSDGLHTVDIMARINGKDVRVFTFKVKTTEQEATPTEIKSADGGNIGKVWLRSGAPNDIDSLKILFKTDKAFTRFGIPIYWASNPPAHGDSKANIEVSLFKFDKDLATTLKGSPVASAKFLENTGDNNMGADINVTGTGAKLTNYGDTKQGFSLTLDEAAPAGQYVIVIRNDAGNGSYLVLPSFAADQSTYGTDCIKYFYNSNEESFEEAVAFSLLLVDEGDFAALDKDSGGTENPTTGNVLAAFAVTVTLALAAAVVFRKRIFG